MSDPLTKEKRVRPRGVWFEEYKTCSCTFLAKKKAELPGYCQKHGNDKRRQVQLIATAKELKAEDFGYAG